MTVRIFRGDAIAYPQITRISKPANAGAVAFWIGGRALRFSAWDVATIVNTWNQTTATPDPVAASALFSAITAAADGDDLLLTADTAGDPFFVTVTAGKADADATNQTTDETQLVSIGNAPTGGTFTLTFSGQTTAAIAYNASAATVQTALEALATIGAGNITATGPTGGPWQLKFSGSLAAQNLPLITGNRAGLTGGTAALTVETLRDGFAGVNCIQSLRLNGSPTAGTFTLSFAGATTTAIAYNATAATVQTALEALATIGAGNITATGGALPAAVTLTFTGTLAARELPQLTGNGANLTTSLTATVTETQAGAAGLNLIIRQNLPFENNTGTTRFRYKLVFQGRTYYSTTFRDADGVLGLITALTSLPPLATATITGTLFQTLTGTHVYRLTFGGTAAGKTAITSAISAYELTTEYVSGPWTNAPNYFVEQLPTGTNERQTIALGGSPAAGTFTLTYAGATTTAIAYNAAAATVQTALEALASIGSGGVSCTGGDLPGSAIVVEFVANGLQATNLPLLTIDAANLNPAVSITTPGQTGRTEIQTLTLTGDPWGGTLTLTAAGNTTGNLAYNATAATVQTALEALAGIGTGKATCTGGPWPAAITAEFSRTLGDLATITATPALNNATITTDETTPGGARAVVTLTQRSRGPNHWDDPTNWTPAGLPATDETAVLDGATDIYHGLRQRATFTANPALDLITVTDPAASFQTGQTLRLSTTGNLPGGLSTATTYYLTKPTTATAENTFGLALTAGGTAINITSAGTGTHTAGIVLTELRIPARFTAALGQPATTDAGDREYRPTALAIDAAEITIGNGTGLASGRLRLDLSRATSITVYATASSLDGDGQALEITTGTAAGSTCTLYQGDTGLATRPETVATFDTVTQHGGTLTAGPGATIGTLTRTAGTTLLDQTATAGPTTLL
jgi:hypothetical protein